MRWQCGDAENGIANAMAQIRICSVSFSLPGLSHVQVLVG